MTWVYFVALSVAGYVCISIFGQLVGPTSTSFWSAIASTFRPAPLGVVLVGNALLGAALYYGFATTSMAIPIAIAVGVITAFVYSVVALGAMVTVTKICGVALIIVGIYLLR